MREVEIRIRMLEPCLADQKTSTPGNGPDFVFLRAPDTAKVLIMQTAWKRIIRFACKAISVSTKFANLVWFDPVVVGKIEVYDRLIKDQNPQYTHRFKRHEAFLTGTEVTIRAVLHDGLWMSTFKKILTAAGRYAGLTLAGFGDYGRFEVLSVK